MNNLIRHLLLLATACFFAISAYATPTIEIQTNMGTIVVELNSEKAPHTVQNFLQYTKDGFYNGTIFHRVINGFMIQGGGFTPDMQQKTTNKPLENEAKNGLKNDRGTIAMARTNAPHSATAQFFINHKTNSMLDYPGQDGWGYAVFGKVTQGMDVVDKIAQSSTGYQDIPVKPIIIQSVKIISDKK